MRYGIALKTVCETCGQPIRDEDPVFTIGRLEVHPVKSEVRIDGTPIHLTPTERRMLTLLAVNAGDLCTWMDVFEAGIGEKYNRRYAVEQKNAIRVHLHRLRKRLGPVVAEYLETVAGEMEEGGLRLRVPEKAPS